MAFVAKLGRGKSLGSMGRVLSSGTGLGKKDAFPCRVLAVLTTEGSCELRFPL